MYPIYGVILRLELSRELVKCRFLSPVSAIMGVRKVIAILNNFTE
jgi:hypothetical protein